MFKLQLEEVKNFKEEEYERFELKVRPAWNRFEVVRKQLYDTWKPADGYFYVCHGKKVEPAWDAYELAITKPYADYVLFCEAIDSLFKVKKTVTYKNKADLRRIIKEEMKRLKDKSELEEAILQTKKIISKKKVRK